MIDRGIIYLLCGGKHDVMGAVSIRSLRQHWAGHVSIFADEKSIPQAERIAHSAGYCEVLPYTPKRYRRNSAYAAKPHLPIRSPYKHTIQLDADTMVVDFFPELWPRHDREFVLTQFANWQSNEGRVRHRIEGWAKDIAEEELQASLESPYPALNTGVVAYGYGSREAREEWAEITNRKPDVFMSDELAAQVYLPQWHLQGNVRVLHDAFNWSPIYHSRPLSEARIIHFHGRKTLHPAAFDIWWPEYQAAVAENWGGLADWTPAGDRRLRAYLKGNDPFKRQREGQGPKGD